MTSPIQTLTAPAQPRTKWLVGWALCKLAETVFGELASWFKRQAAAGEEKKP